MTSTSFTDDNQVRIFQKDELIRVLVVDDDVETTEMLKLLLEPNSFEVLAAYSGLDGVKMARDLRPDVMIVDLLMPEMDGLRVCEEVRKFSSVPIIVLSAISKPNIVAQALDIGADDYLLKPMKNSILIAHINKLARRGKAERLAEEGNGKGTD